MIQNKNQIEKDKQYSDLLGEFVKKINDIIPDYKKLFYEIDQIKNYKNTLKQNLLDHLKPLLEYNDNYKDRKTELKLNEFDMNDDEERQAAKLKKEEDQQRERLMEEEKQARAQMRKEEHDKREALKNELDLKKEKEERELREMIEKEKQKEKDKMWKEINEEEQKYVVSSSLIEYNGDVDVIS